MKTIAVILAIVLFGYLPALVEHSGWVGPAISMAVLVAVVVMAPKGMETTER